MKKMRLLLFSLIVGQLLLIFSWSGTSLFRYVYSLGALFIGIYFFKAYETKGIRITFVLLSILFYFILTVVYVVIGKVPLLNLEPPGANM